MSSPAAASWRDNLVAAALITLLLVPQSLAYAMLAGLPPAVGLAASILPALAYAALGSSPVTVMGPGAVLALMCGQALSHVMSVAPPGTTITDAALVLAAEMGGLLMLGALLRLDTLVALLSVPVLHGFMTGAALTIVATQVPVLVGASGGGTSLLGVAMGWWQAERAAHLPSLVFGGCALIVLWWARRRGSRLLQSAWDWPAARADMAIKALPLLVLGLSMLASMIWQARQQGVATVGTLPSLALTLHWPEVSAPLWRVMLPSAALLALMAAVENLAVAGSLAARRREQIVPRRELAGLGAANLVAACCAGMPVAGGLSRSAVAFDAGARSRWVGVMVAGLMCLSATTLSQALAELPRAVLAATIVLAASSMLDLRPFTQAWRFAKAEYWIMLGAAVLTVLASMELALSVGVVLSVGLLLQRTSDPHVARIGRVPGTEHFRNVNRHAVEELPGVVALRIDESLLFTNARSLTEIVVAQIDETTQRVVLLMSPVNTIDFSGLTALQSLDQALHARGIRLDLAEIKGPVMDRLAAVGWSQSAHGKVYLSLHQALDPQLGYRRD